MATGSTYPGTLDAYVDKLAGDFLTVADVNNRSSAIEKLEAGPLRLNDGSAAAPAYAFRSSASTGMFYAPGSTTLAVALGGVTVGAWLKTGTAVNYVALTAAPTGTGPTISATGTDSNVSLALDTKGTGSVVTAVGGSIKTTVDSSGRLLLGTTQVAGSSTGDFIIASQHSLRSVNAAGSSTVQILGVDASDRLLLGGTGVTDIVWGRALVTMGGGATATMGSIGGSGPTVLTQNKWMQVRDSANALFWVPTWV
jgi:hypothetical protein